MNDSSLPVVCLGTAGHTGDPPLGDLVHAGSLQLWMERDVLILGLQGRPCESFPFLGLSSCVEDSNLPLTGVPAWW